MEFMPKGHTHNSLDQRFEVLNIILKKQEELQSPSMFKQVLEKQYSPVRGPSAAVELLDPTMDFAAWFESMGVSFSGLSATHTENNTCHVWRVVRRADLGGYRSSELWDVDNCGDVWPNLVEDEGDAILLVKEAMTSNKLAHRPMLLFPRKATTSIDVSKIAVDTRKLLSKRQMPEFLKT